MANKATNFPHGIITPTINGLQYSAVDLSQINKSLANVNAVLDIDDRAVGNSGKFYDLFDGTNNYSMGKVDTSKSAIASGGSSGSNNVTVSDGTQFSAGQEVTVQSSTNIERKVISSISTNTLYFTSNLTYSYSSGDMVYRSLTPNEWALASYDFGGASYNQAKYLYSGVGAHLFKKDGTKLLVFTTSYTFVFTLSTAWDISTATQTLGYQNLPTWNNGSNFVSTITSVRTSPDENTLYVQCAGQSKIYVYNWTPWTATFGNDVAELSMSSYSYSDYGFNFNSDGTKLYTADKYSGNFKMREFDLSTPYDITTATYNNVSITHSLSVHSISFNSSGTAFYIQNGTAMTAYTMSTPWDLSTASANTSGNYTLSQSGVFGDFNLDGSKYYVLSGNNIYEYTGLRTSVDDYDIRYEVTPADTASEVAVWLIKQKVTGFSTDVHISIVDTSANESMSDRSPTTTDYDANTTEEEYTYSVSTAQEKVTVRVSCSRTSGSPQLIKLLGAIA